MKSRHREREIAVRGTNLARPRRRASRSDTAPDNEWADGRTSYLQWVDSAQACRNAPITPKKTDQCTMIADLQLLDMKPNDTVAVR